MWLHRLAAITRRFQPRGTDRLLRALHPPGRANSIRSIVDYDDGLLMHVDTRSFLEWYIFFYGHMRPQVSKLINRMLQPGQIAFDIGANIGMHTVIMANRVGAAGKVVVFEPDPHPLERLKKNVALNGQDWVEVNQVALSRAAGKLQLYTHDDSIGNFANASLHAENVGKNTKAIEVDVWAIDDYVRDRALPRLDLIKLLAQGEEWNILHGAMDALRKHRPKVFFLYELEYWRRQNLTIREVKSFFARFGYDVHEVEFGPRRLAEREPTIGQVLLATP